ncbi:hypothetical protein GCM10009710_10300 [Aeromicrobium alkaliterrae]|uniref:Uncharacterized protein n=1 Tax=Aeromicrobium alkaliterrae TaxID=302168 RepID=A0ABP4VR59_9ACTN
MLAVSLTSLVVVLCLTAVTIVALARGGSGDDTERIADLLEELTEFPDDGYAWGYEDDEYFDDYEGDYVVEDDDVYDAVEQPCIDFLDASEALPFLGPGDPVAALTAVRDAVGSIIAAVDETGADDTDTEAWRADLETLRTQLDEAIGVATAGGYPELDLATDGDLAFRMYWGAPIGCEPPLRLLALDPDYPVDGGGYSYSYAS